MDMFITRVNWVDLLVVIIMFRISYIAFHDGLSHEIFPLVAAVCTVVLSLQYYNALAVYLVKNMFSMPIDITSFLSFTVLISGFGLIFKAIRIFLDKIIKVSWHPLIEKFGGLTAGIIRASIVASIILIVLALVPLSYLTTSIKDKSLTGMYFLGVGPAIYEKVAKVLPIAASGFSADSDDIVKNLVADKPAPKETKKKNKLASEWENKLR